MGTKHRGPAREVRALDAYIKLARCTDTIETRLARELAQHGLSVPQLAVLEALLHLGPLCQRELGQKVLRTGGSVTAMVSGLERRGWVRRTRSRDDRRVVLVRLTPSGRRLIRRVFPRHAHNVADAFAGLSAAEQDELARLCKKLGRRAAEPGG